MAFQPPRFIQKMRSCDGKKRYTQEEAERVALKLHREEQRGRWPMGAYACEYCGAWHVGHKR